MMCSSLKWNSTLFPYDVSTKNIIKRSKIWDTIYNIPIL